jgi:hypothetical protein
VGRLTTAAAFTKVVGLLEFRKKPYIFGDRRVRREPLLGRT